MILVERGTLHGVHRQCCSLLGCLLDEPLTNIDFKQHLKMVMAGCPLDQTWTIRLTNVVSATWQEPNMS